MNHVKEKSIFFTALCFAFLIWYSIQMAPTSLRFLDKQGSEHILKLPIKDEERLYSLMRKLFTYDNFAYTLLGSKPVSWASYTKPWSNFWDSWTKYDTTMHIGWKTWSKYRHLFSSTTLWAEDSKHYPGSVSILIVNEEQFNHVVNKHKQDFQSVLNREIPDGFQLLREIKDHSFIYEVLKGHQALLGIVLGYGRDNAWAFSEAVDKFEEQPWPCRWVWDEKEEEKPGEIVMMKGPDPNNIEECLMLMSCPSFSGNPHSEESMVLKRDYLQTQQKIIKYFRGKDFLEATLSLLAGYRPSDLERIEPCTEIKMPFRVCK
ncbi:MAG: hypothetical protein L0207_02670 [Chlamydiae bacterium]|nr:hypothetical protein [Chlamydiota bacterium]